MENKKQTTLTNYLVVGLIAIESIVFLILLFTLIIPSVTFVIAVVGEDNATAGTIINVGNTNPEVISILINNGSAITLNPNATVTVEFLAIVRDYDGEGDISNVSLEFFDNTASGFGSADDNNNHYSNASCVIDVTYGGVYEANATCFLTIQYYANNATWNATARVRDNSSINGTGSNTSIVNTLLALAMPDTVDYGETNTSLVANEQAVNVTNVGNVRLNLSLSGYAKTVGDGNAMNCSLGPLENISINYEKFNLTTSSGGDINLTQFEANYTNLTSSVATYVFNLQPRQNDAAQGLDAFNQTYWRIYVPIGVAGSCTGNIVFGAVESAAT